ALRQGAADDLGQGREDRVLQLGQHQSDEPGPLAPELRGPLVSEHVKGSQHRLSGAVGHAGLAVEYPAHGGLTDADLLGDLGESAGGSSRHAATIRHLRARDCVSWITRHSRNEILLPGIGPCQRPEGVPGCGSEDQLVPLARDRRNTVVSWLIFVEILLSDVCVSMLSSTMTAPAGVAARRSDSGSFPNDGRGAAPAAHAAPAGA